MVDSPYFFDASTLTFLGAAYGDMSIEVYGENVRVTWSPGDATAYEVILAPVADDRVLVAEPRITRGAFVGPIGNLVHESYIADKLRHRGPSAHLTIPTAIVNAAVGDPSYAVRIVAEYFAARDMGVRFGPSPGRPSGAGIKE